MTRSNGVKIELTSHEVEYLRQIHNARALQELIKQPGWEIFTGIISGMVQRLEDQHLNFSIGASRDAYWISGVRLQAAREFAKILQEQVAKEVGILSQPLRPPTAANPEEFDGEIQNGPLPEGE